MMLFLCLSLAWTMGVGGARIERKVDREESTKAPQCGAVGEAKSSLVEKQPCTKGKVNKKVVNGGDALQCAYKWQVGIWGSDEDKSPFCGGTLIAPNVVLTAAHCFDDLRKELGKDVPWQFSGVMVKAGDFDYSNTTNKFRQELLIADVVWPIEYDFGKEDGIKSQADIALISLGDKFKLDNCVGIACLPDKTLDTILKKDPSTSVVCAATGWGTVKSGGKQSPVLQEGLVQPVLTSECSEQFAQKVEINIDESKMCTQGWKLDDRTGDIVYLGTCQGDSGGPVACRVGRDSHFSVYGVTSGGVGCGKEGYADINTDVVFYKWWIDEMVDNLGSDNQFPS